MHCERGSADRWLAVLYLIAHGSKTLFWTVSDLYFVYYLNQICGIRPALTGAIVGLSLLLAAFADRYIGALLQKVASKPWLIRRWQCVGGIGHGLIFLLFATTAYVGTDWKVACAITALMGLRLTYALVDVPQNALLSWSGWASSQVTTLVAGRNMVGGLARLALSLIFVPIMMGPTTSGRAAWFFVLVCVIGMLLAASVTVLARHFPQLDGMGTTPRPMRRSDTNQILRIAILSFMLTGFTQVEPYLVSHATMTFASGTLFMTGVSMGGLFGQAWWGWRVLHHSPARIHAEMLVLAVPASAIMLACPLDKAIAGSLAGLSSGVITGGLLLLAWADFARSRRDRDPFRGFGAFTGAAKLGQAFATVAMGVWLDGHLVASADGLAFRLAAAGFLMAATLVVILLHRGGQSVHRHARETSP